MKRREFIKTAGLAAGTLAFGSSLQAVPLSKEKLPVIGIITGNTGGEWLKSNPKKALQKIADLGYKELEFGGTFGMSAGELKKFLKKIGLKPVLGSTSMAAMNDSKKLQEDILACKELGQKYIVCYWPWTDDGQNKTLDDWKKVANNLNKGGAICKKEGLKLLYHNHDIEFRTTGGQMPFDTLMSNLDPSLVNIELDLYWITKGGQSPVDYIKKYSGRYPVFHVKDMDKTENRDFACVGDGRIDFPSIFKINHLAGVKHFIVEHDKPENPEQCITTSAKYLLNLRF